MRGPRLEMPGGIYHVTCRGNNRAQVFSEPSDYGNFHERLIRVIEDFEWRLHAYALMPNHLHLLVQLTRPGLDGGMQRLLSSYALWRNARTGQSGHVFQGRYGAKLCQKESYLLELVRYIHMNPVRWGLVKHPAEWPWASHRTYMGLAAESWVTTEPVLERFGDRTDPERLARFEAFVMARVPERIAKQLAHTARGAILGTPAFIEEVKRRSALPVRGADRERANRPSLEDLVACAANAVSLSPEEILGPSKRDRCAEARMAVLWLAVKRFGYRSAEVSRFLHRSQPAISQILARAERDLEGAWHRLAGTIQQNLNVKL